MTLLFERINTYTFYSSWDRYYTYTSKTSTIPYTCGYHESRYQTRWKARTGSPPSMPTDRDLKHWVHHFLLKNRTHHISVPWTVRVIKQRNDSALEVEMNQGLILSPSTTLKWIFFLTSSMMWKILLQVKDVYRGTSASNISHSGKHHDTCQTYL